MTQKVLILFAFHKSCTCNLLVKPPWNLLLLSANMSVEWSLVHDIHSTTHIFFRMNFRMIIPVRPVLLGMDSIPIIISPVVNSRFVSGIIMLFIIWVPNDYQMPVAYSNATYPGDLAVPWFNGLTFLQDMLRWKFPFFSVYGGKYVVMQYALRLTTAQISTFMCDLYPNDLV